VEGVFTLGQGPSFQMSFKWVSLYEALKTNETMWHPLTVPVQDDVNCLIISTETVTQARNED